MTILNKVRWIASILLVFFIVLMTNIIDRDNFNKMNDSVITMYEDRIVAADLIFDMSCIIHQKQIDLISGDTLLQSFSPASYKSLDSLIDIYRQTRLTEKEARVFSQLQKELKNLKIKESDQAGEKDLLIQMDLIYAQLQELSKIQVKEGKQQVMISNKAKSTIELFTQGEIIFLILLVIVIQFIIFYKPKEFTEN